MLAGYDTWYTGITQSFPYSNEQMNHELLEAEIQGSYESMMFCTEEQNVKMMLKWMHIKMWTF